MNKVMQVCEGCGDETPCELVCEAPLCADCLDTHDDESDDDGAATFAAFVSAMGL